MKKLFIAFLLFALILPVFGQNQDEFKFSLVPRRVAVPSLTGYLKADRSVALTGVTGPAMLIIDADEKFATVDGVAAGQVLASAGTTTAPAYTASPTLTGNLRLSKGGLVTDLNLAFGTAANTGFYCDTGGNYVNIAVGGFRYFGFNETAGFSNYYGQMNLGGSDEVKFFGESAGVLRLGANSATPQAQVIHGANATGDDVAGGRISIGGGTGTDTGAGGSVFIQTAPAGGAGSNAGTLIDRVSVDSTGAINQLGVNNQQTNIKQATVSLTITAAATATASNLIPAGSLVIGVSTRVTTAVTGDAGFSGINIGNGTDADMFGANVSPLLDATTNLTNSTITAPVIYTAATSIVLTQVGGSTFVAGGVVRITVHYITITAPFT